MCASGNTEVMDFHLLCGTVVGSASSLPVANFVRGLEGIVIFSLYMEQDCRDSWAPRNLVVMMKPRNELWCDPDLLCIHRFDLSDSDADEVRFWRVLESALEPSLTSLNGLVDLLGVIAITPIGTAGTDYGLLRQTFTKYWAPQEYFFDHVWPTLKRLALELPSLFPPTLPTLSTLIKEIILLRRQVACLIVHQFLCTLLAPRWMTDGSPDFHIWYSSNTPHPEAVEAHLSSLFHCFELLASTNNSPLIHDVTF